ncbi:MAG: spinster family MFS transporter, partial [Pseudomonadales bacterium]
MNDSMQAGSDSYPSRFTANYALAILLLAYIFSFIDRQVLSLLVEPMKADLGISDFEVSLLQGMAFALFYTLMGIPIARLADTKRRTLIISIGIALWSAMTCLCGLAKNYTSLFLARVGVGVGEAALSPAAYSMLADLFPAARLPQAMAIFSTGITLGGGLAYLIGGTVLDTIGNSWIATLPILQELEAWQLTFVVVGLPGFIIALLTLTIPEPFRRGAEKTAATDSGFRITLAYLWEHKRSYAALFGGVSLLSVFGYGLMSWYPSLFIRIHDVSASEVGLKFGATYLVFGSLGALSGAWFAQRLAKRGYSDANLRWPAVAALLMMIPGVITPLAPTPYAVFALCVPLIFIQNSYFGVSLAAIQLITPNHMRAQAGAVLLFLTNLIGLGLGPSVVAALTDFVFADPASLPYSLSLVAAIFCPLAAMVFYSGVSSYRRLLALRTESH